MKLNKNTLVKYILSIMLALLMVPVLTYQAASNDDKSRKSSINEPLKETKPNDNSRESSIDEVSKKADLRDEHDFLVLQIINVMTLMKPDISEKARFEATQILDIVPTDDLEKFMKTVMEQTNSARIAAESRQSQVRGPDGILRPMTPDEINTQAAQHGLMGAIKRSRSDIKIKNDQGELVEQPGNIIVRAYKRLLIE